MKRVNVLISEDASMIIKSLKKSNNLKTQDDVLDKLLLSTDKDKIFKKEEQIEKERKDTV